MLRLEASLLLLEAIDLVAISIGFSDLSQIQQTEQARQDDQNNSVANRPERPRGGAKADRVLIASLVAGAIHGE